LVAVADEVALAMALLGTVDDADADPEEPVLHFRPDLL
jgi:hypothetical protein